MTSRVNLGGPGITAPRLLLAVDGLRLEAPNWAPNGTDLYANAGGQMWSYDVIAAALRQLPLGVESDVNNDHLAGADGRSLYVSADDGGIYRCDSRAGVCEVVSRQAGESHYLHGLHPREDTIAYVCIRDGESEGSIEVRNLDTGEVTAIDLGPGHHDGPEWGPDGEWLYFNSESFTNVMGHAQIGRINTESGQVQRLTHSRRVDWFPHLSPDGKFACYLSYNSGTRGHPADRSVRIKLVSTDDWDRPLDEYVAFGGQGSLNVNSWTPDGATFAFISYG